MVCSYLSTACILISLHMQTHTTYTCKDTNVTSALRTSAHELIELSIGMGGVVVLTPTLNREVHTHTHTHIHTHTHTHTHIIIESSVSGGGQCSRYAEEESILACFHCAMCTGN